MHTVKQAARNVNQKNSKPVSARKPAQIIGRAFRCQQWKLAPAAGTGRRDYVATRQKRCAQLLYVLMRYSRAGDGRDIFAAMDSRNGILQSLIELNAGLAASAERLLWSRRTAYVYLKRLRDAKIERIDVREPYHGRARRRVLDATALLAAPRQVCTSPPPRSAHHTSKTYCTTKSQNRGAAASAETAPAAAPPLLNPKPKTGFADTIKQALGIAPSGFDRIKQAFAAIGLKVMGSGKCQNLWANTCEREGATSSALENFFDLANAAQPRIPVPHPMFVRKHELEAIEAADEKTAARIEIEFGKDNAAMVLRACADAGTHISQDQRVPELLRRHQDAERAKQEHAQQMKIAHDRDRDAEFRAAFLKSQQDFGTTKEQVRRWLYCEFRTASLADLTENQFAHALAALENAWHWNRKLYFDKSA